MSKRRHQSQTDRDLDGLAAKKERESAAPDFVFEDLTGKYEGDTLREMRRKRRSTGARLEHLEDKYDRLVQSVVSSRTKIIVAVAGVIVAVVSYLLGGRA